MDEKQPERARCETTAVADARQVPLEVLAKRPGRSLHRIVPLAQTVKPPVAAFDSAL